jgi:hypothetical protein
MKELSRYLNGWVAHTGCTAAPGPNTAPISVGFWASRDNPAWRREVVWGRSRRRAAAPNVSEALRRPGRSGERVVPSGITTPAVSIRRQCRQTAEGWHTAVLLSAKAERRLRTTRSRLALDRLVGNFPKRVLGKVEFDVLHLEQLAVLLDERVLRLDQNALECRLVEVFQRRHHRKAADEFGDQAIFQQVLWFHLTKDFSGLAILRRQDICAKADRGGTPACRDDLLKTTEGAATHEQNVGGVDLDILLLGMLAAALGGTEAMVPSIILRSACCTPSPDTSRVIEGLLDLRLILSISSM